MQGHRCSKRCSLHLWLVEKTGMKIVANWPGVGEVCRKEKALRNCLDCQDFCGPVMAGAGPGQRRKRREWPAFF